MGALWSRRLFWIARRIGGGRLCPIFRHVARGRSGIGCSVAACSSGGTTRWQTPSSREKPSSQRCCSSSRRMDIFRTVSREVSCVVVWERLLSDWLARVVPENALGSWLAPIFVLWKGIWAFGRGPASSIKPIEVADRRCRRNHNGLGNHCRTKRTRPRVIRAKRRLRGPNTIESAKRLLFRLACRVPHPQQHVMSVHESK
jgi:hypothetical protein